LWAIGYDNKEGAEQAREVISRLGWGPGHAVEHLLLLDIAVVVRGPDGSFTLDHKPFPGVANVLGSVTLGFLAGLVVGAPLTGATLGALVGGAGTAAASASAGIDPDFVRQVKGLMRPGTAALFVLDEAGDMEVILHAIQGLGGTVLKTNVDLERARLIQSTLSAGLVEKTKSEAR
jgi:uncharacterized membrane protein